MPSSPSPIRLLISKENIDRFRDSQREGNQLYPTQHTLAALKEELRERVQSDPIRELMTISRRVLIDVLPNFARSELAVEDRNGYIEVYRSFLAGDKIGALVQTVHTEICRELMDLQPMELVATDTPDDQPLTAVTVRLREPTEVVPEKADELVAMANQLHALNAVLPPLSNLTKEQSGKIFTAWLDVAAAERIQREGIPSVSEFLEMYARQLREQGVGDFMAKPKEIHNLLDLLDDEIEREVLVQIVNQVAKSESLRRVLLLGGVVSVVLLAIFLLAISVFTFDPQTDQPGLREQPDAIPGSTTPTENIVSNNRLYLKKTVSLMMDLDSYAAREAEGGAVAIAHVSIPGVATREKLPIFLVDQQGDFASFEDYLHHQTAALIKRLEANAHIWQTVQSQMVSSKWEIGNRELSFSIDYILHEGFVSGLLNFRLIQENDSGNTKVTQTNVLFYQFERGIYFTADVPDNNKNRTTFMLRIEDSGFRLMYYRNGKIESLQYPYNSLDQLMKKEDLTSITDLTLRSTLSFFPDLIFMKFLKKGRFSGELDSPDEEALIAPSERAQMVLRDSWQQLLEDIGMYQLRVVPITVSGGWIYPPYPPSQDSSSPFFVISNPSSSDPPELDHYAQQYVQQLSDLIQQGIDRFFQTPMQKVYYSRGSSRNGIISYVSGDTVLMGNLTDIPLYASEGSEGNIVTTHFLLRGQDLYLILIEKGKMQVLSLRFESVSDNFPTLAYYSPAAKRIERLRMSAADLGLDVLPEVDEKDERKRWILQRLPWIMTFASKTVKAVH